MSHVSVFWYSSPRLTHKEDGMEQLEKRSFDRLQTHLPLSYQYKGGVQKGNTLTRDIGKGGIRFITSEFIPRLTNLILEFHPTPQSEAIKTMGRVVWTQKIRYSEQYNVGVEFVDFPEHRREDILKIG